MPTAMILWSRGDGMYAPRLLQRHPLTLFFFDENAPRRFPPALDRARCPHRRSGCESTRVWAPRLATGKTVPSCLFCCCCKRRGEGECTGSYILDGGGNGTPSHKGGGEGGGGGTGMAFFPSLGCVRLFTNSIQYTYTTVRTQQAQLIHDYYKYLAYYRRGQCVSHT